jgi:hypothetical protein
MGLSIAALSQQGGYEGRGPGPLTPVNGMAVPMVISSQMNLICCDLLLCDIGVMIHPMTFPACPPRHRFEAEP